MPPIGVWRLQHLKENVGKVHKTSRRKGAEEYIIIEIVENQISMLDLIEGDSGSPLNFMATPQLHGVKVCQGDKCCESWSGKNLGLKYLGLTHHWYPKENRTD